MNILPDRKLWPILLATASVRIGYGGIMPILPLYAEQHGLSPIMIAVLTNAYLLSFALFQGPAGHLSDRWGRRPLLIGGLALYAVVAGLFVVDGNIWYYSALRTIEGLGAAAVTPVARAYVADLIPPAGRGKAYGTLTVVENLGLLLGPLVGGLANSAAGMTGPFVACALLGFVAIIPMLRVPAAGPAESDMQRPPAPGPLKSGEILGLLRTVTFWAAALPGLSFAYLNGIYSVVWSLYMHAAGATTWQVSLSWAAYATPVVLFMVPFGSISDRVGRPVLVGAGGALSAITAVSYGLFPAPLALLGLSAVDGVALSMFIPASQAYLADVTPAAIRGQFLGLVGSVTTVATMFWAMVIGYLYARVPALWLFAGGAALLLCLTALAVGLMARQTPERARAELDRLLGPPAPSES